MIWTKKNIHIAIEWYGFNESTLEINILRIKMTANLQRKTYNKHNDWQLTRNHIYH